MRWRTWLAAAAGMVAGYGCYRWLQRGLDGKIRRELLAPLLPPGIDPRVGGAGRGEVSAPAERKSDSPPLPGDSAIETQVLAAVRRQPGLLQTELYGLFPGESRRNLQDLLLRMARESLLQRRRDRSTYRLYAE